jgi:hypothetical protein
MGERDQQADLLQLAVDSCRQEHQDLSSQWTAVDAKAQSTITVAGVFLAAILAFIRELSATTTDLERWLLSGTLVLLIGSTIFALFAVRLRPVAGAPCGTPLVEMIEDLVATEDGTSPERLRNFARDHARLWRRANESVGGAVGAKSRHLQKAQWLLFGAIVAATAVTALKTWGGIPWASA